MTRAAFSTLTRLKQFANSKIGFWLDARGYAITRKYRVPGGTLNMLEAGLTMLAGRVERPIRMVQVGAFDGDYVDPAKALIERGVEAILVEPQPEPAAQLVERHKGNPLVHVENAALALKSGQGTLYRPRGAGASALATLLPERAIEIGPCEELSVSLVSPSDLLAKYKWRHMHILQIDAEGYDLHLLNQFFAGSLYPEILNLEFFNLGEAGRKDLATVLSANGYEWLDWGYDTFAIRRSYMDSLAGITR
jgi:FkbM family methyltransferase